jgi:hypothetical protein
MRWLHLLTFIVALSGTAGSQSWPFHAHPAVIMRGAPAHPKLQTPLEEEHATVIRESAARGPNFAGHFRVVDWGCGTSCGVYVIVDERNGKVFDPPELARGVELGVSGPKFRVNSTLMVVASCPPQGVYGLKNCQRKFYEWNGSDLVLLKTEPVTSNAKPH